MAGLSADASAAAAVAALFFLATLLAPLSHKLTGNGFKLYIPLGVSTALRGIAHAAHASFLVGHNLDLMAVYGALNTAGFGIAVAMCCCFIVIWLRNAHHYQRPAVASALALACKLLVVTVIVFGPVLAVAAAGLVFGPAAKTGGIMQGTQIRVASAAGFIAVAAAALLISTYLSVSWLVNSRHTAAAAAAGAGAPNGTQDPQVHPEQQQQQERQDGLVFVLPATLLLLTWCAASRLAQYDHLAIASSIVLYYTVSVLPELIVAYILALPTLAARVALGGRYGVWLQQEQQGGGRHGSDGSSGSNGATDAEVGIGAPGAQNSKV